MLYERELLLLYYDHPIVVLDDIEVIIYQYWGQIGVLDDEFILVL